MLGFVIKMCTDVHGAVEGNLAPSLVALAGSLQVPLRPNVDAKSQGILLPSFSTTYTLQPPPALFKTTVMVAFDDAADRPEHIDTILNGLDRYNPETTATFQEYVAQQCENQTYDAYANLALLKLYVCLICFLRGHQTPRMNIDTIHVLYYPNRWD